MGYTTTFEGRFDLDRPLMGEHAAYLNRFSDTRRMRRRACVCVKRPDPVRVAAGLPVGDEGGYFIGGLGFAGQDDDDSVLDRNEPPAGQPGLWCQWVPSPDGRGIEWDDGEKFYEYTDWLRYLIEHFLTRWGYELDGEVRWEGEEWGDTGVIEVVRNDVIVLPDDPHHRRRPR